VILEDRIERIFLAEVVVEEGLLVVDINVVTRLPYPRPKKPQKSPSRNAQPLDSNFQSQEPPALHLPRVQIRTV
jgi:hypothetical protein